MSSAALYTLTVNQNINLIPTQPGNEAIKIYACNWLQAHCTMVESYSTSQLKYIPGA